MNKTKEVNKILRLIKQNNKNAHDLTNFYNVAMNEMNKINDRLENSANSIVFTLEDF